MPPTAYRRISHVLTILTTCGALLTGPASPADADAPPHTTCRDVRLPVTLADSTAANLAGTLCEPSGAQTVAVLIPGITYTRAYWDFPYQPERYSFARAANRAGYATLAIDKIGTGASTRPASTRVSLHVNIDNLHQVVQALRAGRLGQQYPKVVAVGHSYGSIIAHAEAGIHHDVDAIVTTGISHRLKLVTNVAQLLLPGRLAALDPRFAGKIFDPGYLTTSPGQRAVFYDARTADPAVVEKDEQLKDTYSLTDLATFLPEFLVATSRGYNGPVLVVNGDSDQTMCGIPPLGGPCSSGAALAADERHFYGPRSTVDGIVVPATGHDIALSTTAPSTTAQILQWLSARVPATD
ncbi:alpha/beta hydrolase [Saccharothrix sp. AJ9571]|nr:alpha/beta hydrolase [Saccharothrix sp. AJ9571]